jgi:hypothetical protein
VGTLSAVVAAWGSPENGAKRLEGTRLVVMTFEARGGVEPGEAETISDTIQNVLGQSGRYSIYFRKEAEEIARLQEFNLTCGTMDCALTKAQRLPDIEQAVFGTVGRVQSTWVLNAYLVDVATATQVRSAFFPPEGQKGGSLHEGAVYCARMLSGTPVPPPIPAEQST